MKVWYSLFLILFSLNAYGVIDMKNSNFADTWTDVEVLGTGYKLRIQRTYNSRSLFNGIFGFGWCSDFETKLDTSGDGSLRVTECGGGLSIPFYADNYDPKETDKIHNQILEEIKKQNKNLSAKQMADYKEELKLNPYFATKWINQLKLSSKPSQNKTYRAYGKGAETIVFEKGMYTRTLTDGTQQKFNANGQLAFLYDKNRNYLKLTYKNNLLVDIASSTGKRLALTYKTGTQKVEKVTGPGPHKSSYKYKGEDLIWAQNQNGEIIQYEYDDYHNLTKIIFPNKQFKKLTYNVDRDWVTSFTNLKGCVETYDYDIDKKSKHLHYTSSVVKKCGKEITNKSSFEFFYKPTNDNNSYLARVKSTVNGKTSDITYHHIHGKPLSIKENGQTIQYSYYTNGLLKSKSEPFRVQAFKYDKSCQKVSTAISKFYTLDKKKKKKLARQLTTSFSYSKGKCNLVAAKNSFGLKVRLKYDSRGRIIRFVDQTKKILNVKYNEQNGKPSLLDRPGLGKITVIYDEAGNIKKVDSKQGPQVAVQVSTIFNNFLELLAPATSGANI